jgi:hypothetical protein
MKMITVCRHTADQIHPQRHPVTRSKLETHSIRWDKHSSLADSLVSATTTRRQAMKSTTIVGHITIKGNRVPLYNVAAQKTSIIEKALIALSGLNLKTASAFALLATSVAIAAMYSNIG